MKRRIFTFILAVGLILPPLAWAQSGSITRDYVGCLTAGALSEFVSASNAKDYRQMQELLSGLCFNLKGREYSTVDVGFMTSTIRVYTSGGSIVLHVPSEAIR